MSDLARAFALALDAPAEHVNGAVLNVGADAQNYTVRTIARTVAEALPEARLSIPGDAGRDVRSYRVRFDRLHRLLPEFACRVDLRAGIADLVAQYRRVGLRSTDGCVRLEHLKRRLAAGEVAADLRPRLPRARGRGPARPGPEGAPHRPPGRRAARPPGRPVDACIACGAPALDPILDLGKQPLANSFLTPEAAARRGPEPAFPLGTQWCRDCRLMQLTYIVPPELLFATYLYVPSTSSTWLGHCQVPRRLRPRPRRPPTG